MWLVSVPLNWCQSDLPHELTEISSKRSKLKSGEPSLIIILKSGRNFHAQLKLQCNFLFHRGTALLRLVSGRVHCLAECFKANKTFVKHLCYICRWQSARYHFANARHLPTVSWCKSTELMCKCQLTLKKLLKFIFCSGACATHIWQLPSKIYHNNTEL